MIRVRVVAPFDRGPTPPQEQYEIQEEANVHQLIQLLGFPLIANIIPVTVNGVQVDHRHRLKEGDIVVFLMPYAGG